MKLASSQWQCALLRWVSLPADLISPEQRLIVALLAHALHDHQADQARHVPHTRRRISAIERGFVGSPGFRDYCAAIGLDPDFVLEQLARASRYDHPCHANGRPILSRNMPPCAAASPAAANTGP